MTFKSVLLLVVAWELIVYYPVAHWVWGGGWLDQRGVLDFAGGIVIHVTAGVSSLVVALGACSPSLCMRTAAARSSRQAPPLRRGPRRVQAAQHVRARASDAATSSPCPLAAHWPAWAPLCCGWAGE